MSAVVRDVEPGSLADKHGIKPGCTLLKINGHDIVDVLDYRFFMTDEVLKVAYKTLSGVFKVVKIHKPDEYEDLGLEFDTYLMDQQRHCKNKCVFCFIDQLPKGMRESLYFKDDDSRMSFFYGNYITLTNLEQADIDRIIAMHISPVNVSVHTMNPKLRSEMMNNRFAGDSLKFLKQLADAGIAINTQLVLCPEINDGDELEFSIKELAKLYPAVQSIACVPVGLTKYRRGLTKLKMYTKKTATMTLEQINRLGDEFQKKNGTRLCFAADEFYLKAGLPIPDADYYEEYPQLDNGVGLWRSFEDDVMDVLKDPDTDIKRPSRDITISIATGVAAYPLIKKLAFALSTVYGNVKINTYAIQNDFFGHRITVAGLITGQDLVSQLKDEELGECLLIPSVMLRTTYPANSSNDDTFLDDMTTDDVSKALGVPLRASGNDGYEFVKNILEVGECQDR